MKIAKLEWNEFLCGFVSTLDDGRTVQVQFDKNNNRLDANYDNHFAAIDTTNEYGLNLNDEEKSQFLSLLKEEFSHEINPVKKALDNPLLSYDQDLKIAIFNGVLFRDGAYKVSNHEEAHNIRSIDEARSIWGILENDNIPEEIV